MSGDEGRADPRDGVAIGRRAAVLGGSALAAGAAPGPAATVAAEPALRRGVGLSSWFANAPRQPLFARDFAQLAHAGFDHVRLPVNPELIGYKFDPTRPSPNPADAKWQAVDDAIVLAIHYGLAVVFDLHPEESTHLLIELDARLQDDLVAFARYVAARYRTMPTNRFAFELLNEPQFYGAAAAYQSLAGRLHAAVRAELPETTLLLGGPFGNSLDGLLALTPIADPKLRYVFHFYQPYLFTYQGTSTGFEGTEIHAFRNLPYPAARIDPAVDYAPGAHDRGHAESELREYRDQKWGPGQIAATLHPAVAWAASHGGLRLACTEFGAHRPFVDPASRYRWIGDVRKALEAAGIGWTVWDYADLFAITEPIGATDTDPVDQSVRLRDPAHGEHRLEPPALAALGLPWR